MKTKMTFLLSALLSVAAGNAFAFPHNDCMVLVPDTMDIAHIGALRARGYKPVYKTSAEKNDLVVQLVCNTRSLTKWEKNSRWKREYAVWITNELGIVEAQSPSLESKRMKNSGEDTDLILKAHYQLEACELPKMEEEETETRGRNRR